MRFLSISSPLVLAVILLINGCSDQIPQTASAHESTVSTNYVGKVQGDLLYYGLNSSVESWADFDETGNPTRIGITISESFVHRGSEGVSAKLDPDQHHMNTGSYFDLSLPEHAGIPFEHAYFSYHPMGHVPPGIYDMPHFDFHFYLISSDARRAMAPEAVSRAMEPVGKGYLPATYRAASRYNNFYWPYMGTHFVSDNTDEIEITDDGDIKPGPSRFDQTFIYGTFGGEVVFLEPMVAASHLESVKASDEQAQIFDIEQPARFEKAGFYPTKYRIAHSSDPMTGQGYYSVSLEDLVWRDAS